MPPRTTPKKTATRKAKRSSAAKRPAKRRPARRKAKRVERLVRTSERSSFNRCRWAWQHDFPGGLTPIHDAPALRFGTLIHAALEARYPKGKRRGPKPAPIFEQLYEEELREAYKIGFRDDDGKWQDAAEVGVSMLEGYVREYGKDEEWEVIASELTFQVPMFLNEDGTTTPWKGDRYQYTYVGTMDGVWRNRMDGAVLINDYKTTSGDPVQEARGKHSLDEQATAYWTWGVDFLIENGVLPPRDVERLHGMLYTFLKKAKADDRPENADGLKLNRDGSVSKQQPAPRFHRELVYRSEAEREKARVRASQEVREMEMVVNGELPARKSPGTGYPSMQCKACAFRDMCELDEMDQDWEAMRDATMKKWDPYAAHEIEEENKR